MTYTYGKILVLALALCGGFSTAWAEEEYDYSEDAAYEEGAEGEEGVVDVDCVPPAEGEEAAEGAEYAEGEEAAEGDEASVDDGCLDVAEPFNPTFSATLAQLGINYTMQLRGIEGSDSVSFDVRADQVVSKARVNLEYSYSPALIPELSQLNVMVNDQLATSLALPQENAGSLQQAVVDIPPHLITEFNRLSLQLIGHYTMECEDPLHTSLWAKISTSSSLEMEATPIVLPDDLAKLPLPFFDPRDSRQLQLPFVFTSTPDNLTLEAAGAVSSWFGALASYRGARFSATLNELPSEGSAIVFMTQAAPLEGLEVESLDAPVVSIQANPNDPYGKLLIISGRDSEQLRTAALALVTGSQAMAGPSARVDGLVSLKARKPYDAPNWLPSDRAVQLGELLEAKKLSVAGYNPGTIKFPLRLPPDLFTWRDEGIPLHLKYRYTPQPVSTNSSLLISVSGKFIKSVPLPSQEHYKDDQALLERLQSDDSLLKEVQLRVPVNNIPQRADLELRYMYDYIKQGDCRDIIIDNMRGTIEPDSTIDISDYDHYIVMPNMGVFQSSGFPFTRMADLSETAVVVAPSVSLEELSLFLDVMGRFGESTGLPASAFTVSQGEDDSLLDGKDILLIATAGNQPLLQRWAEYLPASLQAGSSFEFSDLAYRLRTWISPDDRVNRRTARNSVALGSGGAGAYLAGFESPLDSGRSVVVLAGANGENLANIAGALRGDSEYDQPVQGSLVVVNGTRVNPLVAEDEYYVGSLGIVRYLQWLLARNLGWMVFFTALGVLLASVFLYLTLKARANARLKDAQ